MGCCCQKLQQNKVEIQTSSPGRNTGNKNSKPVQKKRSLDPMTPPASEKTLNLDSSNKHTHSLEGPASELSMVFKKSDLDTNQFCAVTHRSSEEYFREKTPRQRRRVSINPSVAVINENEETSRGGSVHTGAKIPSSMQAVGDEGIC